MATKKSSSTRKKTPEKKGSGRKKAPDRRETEAREQLYAVVLFAFGILLFFFAVIPGESAWLAVHRFLLGCLSWCAYLVGPLVVCTAVMIATDQSGYPLAAKLTAATVLVLLFCGALQIFQREYPDGSFFELVAGLYEDGQDLAGGGVFALFFGVPLLKLASFTGAVIIILLLIFIFLMILSGGTLMGLLRGASAPVKRLGEAYSSAVENRAGREEDDWDEPPARTTRREAVREPKTRDKKAQKEPREEEPVYPDLPPPLTFPPAILRKHTDIDVPIDGQPLPQHGERAPRTAIRPEPLPPEERGRLVEETANLPRKDAYDFDRQEPGAEKPAPAVPIRLPGQKSVPSAAEKKPLTEEELLAVQAAELVREGLSDDDILARAVTGDTLLAHIPETAGGRLDFGGELPDDEAVIAAANLPEAPPEPEPEPEPEAVPEPVPEPLPEPDAPSREEPEKPLPVRLPDNTPHPDNTVAPSMADVPEDPPYEYEFPTLDLLDEPRSSSQTDASRELRSNAELLENTLKSFGVQARIIDVSRGPAVTRYELQPAAGVKISKVTGLADDIALNLSAAGVRIEAPIPGKPAIGIEVPNKVVATVSIREILDSPVFQNAASPLTVALGRDITGGVTVGDISRMPHVLIAGATGSGKSVCINSIIISLLYKSSPEQVKFLMIDPKVVELGVYNGIPHLLVPVVTDPRKAAGSLAWAVGEMMKRYKLFAETGVRNLQGYNLLAEEREDMKPMPQIVIIIDELADLMMSSPKEVEDHICRLAQLARAAGMHLVIATQRPSVDVITGLIKANIPSRIAFAVSSAVDSRTILDGGGAEKLLGRGDMLFSPVGAPKPMRVQGCFVTDQEVERVVSFVKQGGKNDYDDEIMEEIDRQAAAGGKGGDKSAGGADTADEGEDELLAGAIEVVVEAGLASTSLLQRRLKVGYARAARLVDEMEQRGIVGPFEGSKPRQVLLTKERYYEMKVNQAD